jgi:4-carboxymuconolactone decarboxylase
MGREESLVHAFCLQAHTTGRVDDATFAAAKELFGLDGVLELLALNGYYSMMAMVLNSSGIPLPEGAAPPLQAL